LGAALEDDPAELDAAAVTDGLVLDPDPLADVEEPVVAAAGVVAAEAVDGAADAAALEPEDEGAAVLAVDAVESQDTEGGRFVTPLVAQSESA
jgi:hypothetical protein